ncbi:MAG: hypothetical protein ACOX8W_09860 [bacterium]|jgi:drug/metabolite transporter (DMT)-like permease
MIRAVLAVLIGATFGAGQYLVLRKIVPEITKSGRTGRLLLTLPLTIILFGGCALLSPGHLPWTMAGFLPVLTGAAMRGLLRPGKKE